MRIVVTNAGRGAGQQSLCVTLYFPEDGEIQCLFSSAIASAIVASLLSTRQPFYPVAV